MEHSIETLVRQFVPLPHHPNGLGFYPILCKVCNDHGKKGPRAGFRFDNNNVIGYNCFNCNFKTKFDPNDALAQNKIPTLNGRTKQLFDAFSIPESEVNQWVFNLMKTRGVITDSERNKVVSQNSIEPNEIQLPTQFYRLSDADPSDKWALIASDYLEHDRKLNPDDYPYYLSRQTGDPRLDKWVGRLIIPVFKNKKLIFYQGRALYNHHLKYESVRTQKNNVLFGFDELFSYSTSPLYVTEGVFDAMHVNGVALLGRSVSESQIEWLSKTSRQKVFIPDKKGEGSAEPAEQFIKLGWSISTPDIGSCGDINDAINKYGKLYVMKTIADNIASGITANIRLGVYCDQPCSKSKKKNKMSR